MSFLEVSQVSKAGNDSPVLNNISFTQARHERIAIAGETGSGKSSLLKIIAGLGQADSGTVTFEGKKVEGALEKLVPGHPRIGYLSQHFELPKFLRVEQVLSYANTLSEKESENLYDLCQIGHLQKRKTDQLSGGERQRIALARNLITSPSLLLLDEPFSNLDVIHKNTLKEIISDLSAELQISLILVSHDPDDTLSWAHKILVMRSGQLIQQDTPTGIYQHPIDEYCAGLFGKYSALPEGWSKKLGLNNDRSKYVRPEQFLLSESAASGVPVTISAIRFFGPHFEIEVTSGDDLFTVLTPTSTYHLGQHLFLKIEN